MSAGGNGEGAGAVRASIGGASVSGRPFSPIKRMTVDGARPGTAMSSSGERHIGSWFGHASLV